MHYHPVRFFLLSVLTLFLPFVVANTEKTIFIAPPATILPTLDPALDDLGLQRLSPRDPVHRAKFDASFPTDDQPGTDAWYFLENLHPGQRYEVRVCWLATQPTAFTLDTFTLRDAIDDPSLLSAISIYAKARLSNANSYSIPRDRQPLGDPSPSSDSVLFLRVRVAADYFSLDSALMESVPPVVADIILDPFLANIFPKSLVPTAGYTAVVACLAVVLSRFIWKEFQRAVEHRAAQRSRESKKAQ